MITHRFVLDGKIWTQYHHLTILYKELLNMFTHQFLADQIQMNTMTIPWPSTFTSFLCWCVLLCQFICWTCSLLLWDNLLIIIMRSLRAIGKLVSLTLLLTIGGLIQLRTRRKLFTLLQPSPLMMINKTKVFYPNWI
jgi:hypothetical protein